MPLKEGYQQLKMKVILKIGQNLIGKNVEICLNNEKNTVLQEISITKVDYLKTKFLKFEDRECFTALTEHTNENIRERQSYWTYISLQSFLISEDSETKYVKFLGKASDTQEYVSQPSDHFYHIIVCEKDWE